MFILRIITCFIGLTVSAGVASGVEMYVMKSRVPADQMATIQNLKNPLPLTDENIEKGKTVYSGKGKCILCHGVDGDGKGLAGIIPDTQPSPRNFRNPEWQKARTDGELKWIITFGVPGSGMQGHGDVLKDDEEVWQIVHYIRSFGKR